MVIAAATALITAAGLVLASPAVAAPKATGISANGDFGCAVMATHGVECWGVNTYGELGNGTTTDSDVPVHVLGISHAVSVTTGGFHACALLSTGMIKCWGLNDDGELGDGTTTDSHVPVFVSGILHATKVSAGFGHTCAILKDGAAKCWGYNAHGQLGDGTTTDSDTPVQVAGMKKNVTWISAGGDNFACGVQLGVAKCWGSNDNGQLGNGTTVDSHVPHEVLRLGHHTRIINAGFFQACALEPTPRSGNALFCWGGDSHGEVGNGTPTPLVVVPVRVSGMQRHVTSISPGQLFTCAVQSGAAKCWGYNNYGQLGDGTTTTRHHPRQVVGLAKGAVKISAGLYATCALLTTGAAKCWGENLYGQLGNNSTTDSPVPVRVHLI